LIDVRPGRVPAIEPDGLYSIAQLANALRVSPRTVERHLRHGVAVGGELLRLPATRIGKVWRVRGRDVLDWLAAQQPQAVAPPPAAVAPAHRRRLVDQELDDMGL